MLSGRSNKPKYPIKNTNEPPLKHLNSPHTRPTEPLWPHGSLPGCGEVVALRYSREKQVVTLW